MYGEISPQAARRYSLAEFTDAYGTAQETATVARVTTEDPSDAESGGQPAAAVPVSLETRAFGQIAGRVLLPLADEGIAWSKNLVFPGLGPKEQLVRRAQVPERAPILARDGTSLAEGPAASRSSPLGAAAQSVAGAVAAPNLQQDRELSRLGFPPGTPTGTSGLELAFNRRLSGRPGGQLVAVRGDGGSPPSGGPVLASAKPLAGKPVHTTIDPGLQQAAVAALGSQFGGVAVLDARDGSVLALAGIAFSGPQPPGSTFKVITSTAALEAGIVELTDQFPIQTSTVIDGREVANAHNEACGGSFVEAFAKSCNSVFAPLGAKIGSERLVEEAERYGFNSPPSLYDDAAIRAVDPPQSTIPASIPSDLEVGVSAIGQGQVLATPLEMASVAQTIANGGIRSPTRIVQRSQPATCRSTRAGDLRAGRDNPAQPDGPGRDQRDRHGSRPPGHPGGRQDRHRRAGAEGARARFRTDFRRGARAEAGCLVHRLRAGERPEARGGGNGRQRKRGRRRHRGSDRSPGPRRGPRRRLI